MEKFYKLVVYKGVYWKKDEEKFSSYKAEMSTFSKDWDEIYDIYLKVVKHNFTVKGILIKLLDKDDKVLYSHATAPDGKELGVKRRTVEQIIEENKHLSNDYDLKISIFDYRLEDWMMIDAPLENIQYLGYSIKNLSVEDYKVETGENDNQRVLEICVNS